MVTDFPSWLAILERRLAQHDEDYKWIASETDLTIADFCLGGFLCSVHANEENPNYLTFSLIIGKYPRVSRYLEEFQACMADYLKARPPRPM